MNWEGWQVSLGGTTQSTTLVTNASHGFSGWRKQSFSYTATSSSELLSFLAQGGPGNGPPFALLDGVTLNASVPDATSTLALLGAGSAVIFFGRLRRRSG